MHLACALNFSPILLAKPREGARNVLRGMHDAQRNLPPLAYSEIPIWWIPGPSPQGVTVGHARIVELDERTLTVERGVVDMALQRSLYAKYGGVHFIQTASTRDINDFVRQLPADQRDSLFEVLDALDGAGLIQLQNDGHILNPHGEMHPDHPNEEEPLH